MKRLAFSLTSIFLCVIFCLNISAMQSDTYSISIDNVEFIFNSNSVFSNEEQLRIAQALLSPSDNAQTYGLMCTLFGHKYTSEVVVTVTHNVNSSAPKCLRETWQLNVCSRCEHTEGTVIDSYYINCCP